jgi:transcriptional regulator CtsR
MKLYFHLLIFAIILCFISPRSFAQFTSGGPQPGDVYKEYTLTLPNNNTSWRVTDPNATYVGEPGNSPSDFLPNPVHTFSIDDFSDVERAEIVIDVWGGHVGTVGKKIRFNSSPWITIPELNTTPTSGQCYTQQVTYVLDVPISDLSGGTNSIEGTSGGQTCYNFNWGQWGWYGAKIRVYYSSSKGATTGQIISHTSGSAFSDNPTIQISADGTVDQVDFLAKYDDYDVDGDGYYNEWVEDYQRRSWNDPVEINNHIGTVTTSPYSIVWNTEWVPDQTNAAVSLIARIKNEKGYWYVTDIVENLTLSRSGYSIKLYKPQNVPERFWVRNGQVNSSLVSIPTLAEATEAKVHIRTWNGNENNASFYTRVNSTDLPAYGRDHFFSYDIVDIPINSLATGNNTITFQSSTADHGIEVLWPGPAIMVKYGSVPSGSVPIITQQPVSQNAAIGQSVDFSVVASSDSPLTYQWTKNGIDIPGEDQSMLSIASVTPIENSNVYTCKVTNSYGTVISSSATLNVTNTGVRISNAIDEGIDCYKIETEFAIYYFDKAGGGLVSLIDKDGIDWISHNPTPGTGSAGEYRGFPNTGELHPGYIGGASSTISPTNVWEDSVVVQTSRNGEEASFTFFSSYAKMILTAIGGSDNAYWVLFEGTPGGAVGADDRVYLSNGTNFDANQDHPFGSNDITNLSGNAIGSEWMYITDGIQDRSLFLAITDDDIRDNYWQMEDNMTVFGSGREQGSVIQYRTDVNAEVIIGFVESKESVIVESLINNAWEGNSSGDILLPPTNLTVTEVSDGVELNWVDNSNNELGFEIERSENGGSFSLINTTGANISSYVDLNVTQSNAYEFRIRATNDSGTSNYSNIVSIIVNGRNTSESLVLNLPFNGSANDLSNNGNDGTINGAQLTTDKDNTAGMAYSFDGSDDFIEIADAPELNVDQITMTGWIYTDSYKDDQRIISKETGTTMPWSSYTLLLSGTGERQLEFRIGIGGERFRLASTSDIPLNQWVHVAGTYDGTTMRLYINGQLNNSLAASGVIQDTPNPIYVGGSQFWPRFFDGKIDEVRVYNASLDAQEIEDIYNNVSAGPTIPQAPTSLAVQELSPGVAGLTWTDNSDNEEGFIIERQEDSGGYVELDSIGADQTSYNDSTVVAGFTYDYRIFASNATGRSTESNVATIIIEIPVTVPEAPTALDVTELSQTVVSLTWTDNSTNEEGFIIERQEDGGGYAQLDSIGADQTNYNDSTVVAGVTYDYRIFASNATGRSTESNVATIIIEIPVTVPEAPTALDATELSQTVIGLTWTDNSTNEEGFIIERQEDGGGYAQLDSIGADQTSYIDSTVVEGVTYDYRIKATNIVGRSLESNITSLYIQPLPAAPTNLLAQLEADSTVQLSWTDNSMDEDVFIIERQEEGGGFIVLDSTLADINTYKDTTLIVGANYEYKVSAKNDNGISAASNVVSIQIIIPPQSPTLLQLNANTDLTITLNWIDNSDNEDGFVIERMEDVGLGYEEIISVPTNVTSYIDTELSAYTEYTYRVYAINTAGQSDYTNEAVVQTGGIPTTPIDFGHTLVYDRTTYANARRAQKVEVPSDGDLNSISIYHEGGSGGVLLGVYSDLGGLPGVLLGASGVEQVNNNSGWQEIQLQSPVSTENGQKVWLAWVFETIPGIKYTAGTPGRATSTQGWSAGLPDNFGSSTTTDYVYSIYATMNGMTVSIPVAPGQLSVSELSNTVVSLTWTDNSTNEEGFIIERQEDGGGYAQLDSIGADQTNYNDSTVVAGVTYDYRIFASNAAGRSTESNVATIQLNISDGPLLTLWYRDTIAFGQKGNPQKWVNVLGNVSDNGTVDNFYYQLNGGSPVNINIGPDDRRLVSTGDFNIDIDANELTNGSNTLSLYAEDDEGNINSKNIAISYTKGNVWDLNSTIDWQNTDAILQQAQVVDGKWQLTNEGVRPVEIGYDRLIAIGDTTWTDYEVIVPIEIHALDTEIGINGGNEYGIGLLMRWLGHTDEPVAGWSPKSGWEPYGEIGWFNWDKNTQANSRISFLNAGISQSMPILFNQKYLFRFRVETLPNGSHEYRLKVWLESNTEPAEWDLIHTANSTELDKGSFMLIAHHVDATFGNIQVNSLQSTTPNPPSELIATQIENRKVELSWTDNSINEEGFVVERSIDNAAFVVLDTLASNMTNYLDSTIVFGANHDYRISSFNNNGPSVYSDTVTINIDPPPRIPIAPTNLVATEISKTIIELSWTDNSNDEDGFIIERQENSGVFEIIETTLANENVFTDSLVIVGRNYTYQMRSYNSAGSSIDSATISIITCEETEVVFDNYVYQVDTIATNNAYWWAQSIGDIDKNGFADIVFQNNNANGGYLGWMQADDNGTSWIQDTIAITPPTGGTFASGDLDVGDIDGDGDLDVIGIKHTGEWDNPNASSEIYWFKNPTWESVFIGTANDFIKEVELSDLNSDGLPDLVVSTFESNQLHIYRQDPGDTWTNVLNTSLVNLHEGMDVGDIDGDGDTDIAANGYWIQNPGGDLSSNWAVKIIDDKWHNQEGNWEFNATKIYCQDINSDGKVEVFIANSENSGYPISWYELTDTLNNTWNENIIATCWSNVHTLQVFDVDFDGDFDVLAGENGGQLGATARLGVFINNGNNQDWAFQEIHSNGGYNALVYDMDGNGTNDMVWMDGHTDPLLRIAKNKNNLPLSFGDWQRHVIDSLKPARSIFINSNDLDGDNRNDIITGGWWYKNPGNNDGLWVRNNIGGNINNMAATLDIDEDNDIDILGTTGVGSNPSSDFVVAYNDGQGSFIYEDITDGQGDFIQGIAVNRFQNNELGIAISWHEANQGIQMLTNSLGNWNWSTISSFSQDEDLSTGDIDRDGDDDLLLGTHWLRNEGDSWTDYTLNNSTGFPDRNELIDINRDGRLDAVVGYEAISTQGKIAWYEQPENPTSEWIEHIISVNEIGPMSLDVTDIDFDGDIDIVIGEHNLINPESTECIIFENRNNGASWNKHVVYVGDEHHDGTRFTDIDGDGDMDIISIGWGHSKVLLYENLAIDLPIPLPPTTLDATELSQTVVGLTWTDNSDNEEGFIIERQEDGAGYAQLDSIGADQTNYNDSTVVAGVTYDYRIFASNAAGRSTESNVATIINEIPVTVPEAPTALDATELSQTVVGLTWTDNSTNEEGFIIERQEDGGGYAQLDSIGADQTNYNDSTVVAGITYGYRIFASNAAGRSTESNVATIIIEIPVTVPEAPTALDATELSQTVVGLTWTDNSTNEEGFIIERQEDSGGYVELDSIGADQTSYNDSTVVAGVTYDYRIKATNVVGRSLESNVAGIYIQPLPAAPTNLLAQVEADSVVQLIWTDNSSDEEGFRIERQDNTGGYVLLDSVGIDVTNYADTTVIPGINYDYRVLAYNGAGVSTPSNEETIYIDVPLTVPEAPTNLQTTILAPTVIGLDWTDNSDNEKRFIIERQENGGGYVLLDSVGIDVTSYNDSTVAPGITYDYQVRSKNDAGQSTPGNVATGYITPVPEAPTSLTSTELNQTTVLLSWTDNSDNEEGFEIERSENGGPFNLLTTIGADTSTYQDMTVGPAMSYGYRVRAVNGTGASAYSNTTNITMSGPPSNLVLDLRFSGDATDWSSYGNNGILNGPVLTTDKDNTAGMAYSFDGSDDFIEIADSPELNVDQITMTGWIYTDSYKDDQRIISKETGTTMPWSSYTLLLSGTGERQLEFRIGIGGERFRLASTSDIPLNQWVHVAGIFDGTTMRLYINGQLNNTLSASGVIQDTPNPIYVGGSQFWPRAFDGKLDEIRVYNDALTDTDIFNSYSTSNSRIGNNEVKIRNSVEQLKTVDVLAYPNPLALGSELTIRLPENITEKELLDLHVIDIQGKILTKIELSSSYMIDNNSSIKLK